jgi:hypothetical protein
MISPAATLIPRSTLPIFFFMTDSLWIVCNWPASHIILRRFQFLACLEERQPFGLHLDPLMGIVGALVISRWSSGLLNDTSSILLDRNIEKGQVEVIRQHVEADSDNRGPDLHVWKVGPVDYAADT